MSGKRTGKYNPRIGKMIFFVPAAIIIILVVYAFVQLNAPGTLILSAEDENQVQLQVHATVNGQTVTTPSKVSLSQGSYTVDFATITWYYPPASRSVVVTPGGTVYAVGVYQPAVKFVQVTPSGFNVTSITVLHGVTPVTWINPSSSLVTFSGGSFQQLRLEPGQSYTYVFPTTMTFEVNIGTTNETMTIIVQ